MNLLNIKSTLGLNANKTHISHPFSVPEGTTRLHLELAFTPRLVSGQPGANALSMTLFDPAGVRGAGHNRDNNVIDLSTAFATAGYVAGPIPAGVWDLVIDVHMVVPNGDITYTLTADASTDPVMEPATIWPHGVIPQRGPGWFRGDLHSHTIHSDGSWDVPDVVAAARRAGLDFMVLTDHNTVSPLAQMDSLSTAEMLTFGGIELTTYYGHALALGVRHWIDWRVKVGERSMPQIADEVEAAGGTFVIAHPMSPGDPECTGCDWRYVEMMPGSARVVEIWNGGEWARYNEMGLRLWYSWLNEGYRIAATSGTDVHGPQPDGLRVGFNNVYAEALTEMAILDAIRRGHNYVSSGPVLDFTAVSASGAHAMMGDALPNELITLTIRWRDVPNGAKLRHVVDGNIVSKETIDSNGEFTWGAVAGAFRWRVVEIRDVNGDLLAVTNPIYVERAV